MSRSPRAEAIHLMHTGEPIDPPVLPRHIERDSPEALAHIDSYREGQFVVMARAIDEFLENALTNRRPAEDRVTDEWRYGGNKWRTLAEDWRMELLEDYEETEHFKQASKFSLANGRLRSNSHVIFDTQLMGGVSTALSNTVTLLRNTPHIIRHHSSPEEELDPGTVSRHPGSLILIRSLAKTSVNRAMAAQTALANEEQKSPWSDFDKVLDPRHFRLNRHANGSASLGYADFAGLKVPAGYQPHEPTPATTEVTLAREIPSQQKKVIGCPITLLQGRLGQLWNWAIDLVEANELWEETWPPATSS